MSAGGRGSRHDRDRVRDDGFALLIVLWTLVLLAMLVTQLTAAGRAEALLASNLRRGNQVQSVADAGIYEAAFRLLGGQWKPGGAPHKLRLPHGAATITVESEAGKIGVNSAPMPLLQALLRRIGVAPAEAVALTARIMDWRNPGDDALPQGAKLPQYQAAGRSYGPPNAGFESLDELALVLGMTPDLLDRLRPHLSVYYGGDPDRALADPVVAQAVADAAGEAAPAASAAAALDPATQVGVDRSLLVTVTSAATGADGIRFLRRAVLHLAGAGPDPCQVLTWENPSD